VKIFLMLKAQDIIMSLYLFPGKIKCPPPQKKEKVEEIYVFKSLDIFFCGLDASPGA
jgi:hypothetical protein